MWIQVTTKFGGRFEARVQQYIDDEIEESLNLDYKAAGALAKTDAISGGNDKVRVGDGKFRWWNHYLRYV